MDPWQRIGPLSALGASVVLETPDAELADLLRELYGAMEQDEGSGPPPVVFRVAPPSDDQRGELVRDGEVVGTPASPAALLDLLVWHVNQHVIRSSSHRLVMHAAAVSRDGSVVLLPAAMDRGKTTLAAGLMGRGLTYLTDEAACVAPDLAVEGYPKPLTLDPGSWPVLDHLRPAPDAETAPYFAGHWQIDPRRLGPVARSGRLSSIVLPGYQHDAPTEVTPLSPAEGLERVARCVFVEEGGIVPATVLQTLAPIVEAVPTFELVYGELSAACDAVLELLNRPAPWDV